LKLAAADAATLSATVSGTEEWPRLDLQASGGGITVGASGAEHADAHIRGVAYRSGFAERASGASRN
jgi:hypothetical protein